MTEQWWLNLTNGAVGAFLGALVAIVVLKVSLRQQSEALTKQLNTQDKQHLDQLEVQAKHHQAQLESQDKSITAQLEAQRLENSRGRINQVAGQLMAAVASIPRGWASRNDESGSYLERVDQCFVIYYTLCLDLGTDPEDSEFTEVLHEWLHHLFFSKQSQFETGGTEIPEAWGLPLHNEQAGWVTLRIAKWIPADKARRRQLNRELKESLAHADKGAAVWKALYSD